MSSIKCLFKLFCSENELEHCLRENCSSPIWALVCIFKVLQSENASNWKLLRTLVARKWVFTCMSFKVLRQTSLLRKSLQTLVTRICLLIHMSFHLSLQITSLRKGFRTLVTRKWLFTCIKVLKCTFKILFTLNCLGQWLQELDFSFGFFLKFIFKLPLDNSSGHLFCM